MILIFSQDWEDPMYMILLVAECLQKENNTIVILLGHCIILIENTFKLNFELILSLQRKFLRQSTNITDTRKNKNTVLAFCINTDNVDNAQQIHK